MKTIDLPRLVVDTRAFLAELDRFFPGSAAAVPVVSTIDAEDWAEGWKRGFPPLEIGRSLRVRPPWIATDASTRHDIVIEPSRVDETPLGGMLWSEADFEEEEEGDAEEGDVEEANQEAQAEAEDANP